MGSTPKTSMKTLIEAVETRSRLEKCWGKDLNWELYPTVISKGCEQIGRSMSMPPLAVLSGIMTEVAFCMSHASVAVPDTDWVEPVLLWVSIGMPTGSGKSPLYKYLLGLLRRTHAEVGLEQAQWLLEEATFEKMGAMMAANSSKLLGLYDELSSFLTQINLYKARGMSDSHDLALFLQLYNGHPWTRKTVTGEANFSMEQTSLTIGGFTQPAVARSLIEMPANIEKGLSTRFLWVFPKPCYSKFSSLQPVDSHFTNSLVCLLVKIWSSESSTSHHFTIPKPCETFSKKYDIIQEQLEAISGVDELLSGTLSKAKGLILRVAGVLHVLFHLDKPDDIPSIISEAALQAAENYVDLCCQHTAFLAGKGDIEDAIFKIQKAQKTGGLQTTTETASYILLLPGKVLDISALNTSHKFKNRGNKAGAVAAIKELEAAGLGIVKEKPATRGTSMLYHFEKKAVPTDKEAKAKLCCSLSRYHVSLKQYEAQLKPALKRQAEVEVATDVRRSPRLSGSSTPVTTPSATTPTSTSSTRSRRNLFQ